MRMFAQKPKAPQQDRSTVRDRESFGQSHQVGSPLFLQQTIGNQAVQRLHAALKGASTAARAGAMETELAINKPGDQYEQEADRIADQVMQRVEATPIHLKDSKTRHIAAQEAEGQPRDEERFTQAVIFRKVRDAPPRRAAEGASAFTQRLVGRQSGGERLPKVIRRKMENAFGHDFSRVRIHRDAEAGEMSRQAHALAFTHGSHIYFGSGRYDPHGSTGGRLLAHELTHVVQQGEAGPRRRAAAKDQAPVEGAPIGPTNRTSAPIVQRTATFAAGTVNEVNDLVDVFLSGTAVGFTPPMLNGSIVMSTADTRAAMDRPTLSFSSSASGGVDAQVATVPTNTGSFDETVLAAGPWTRVVPRATVGARFPTLAACTGTDPSTFRAIGRPSDAHMFAANRRHEDRHATDHETAFNGSVVPWDTSLTTAQTSGTTFNGPTQADAEAALWTAMGGTPDQTADAYFNEAVRLNNVFHGTAAGGPVTEESPTSNADCSTSSITSHNPS